MTIKIISYANVFLWITIVGCHGDVTFNERDVISMNLVRSATPS